MNHWDAALYDRKHSFVAELGETLITLLAPQRGEQILDLGCGTGTLTNQITRSGAEVTGIDSSADMIEQAKKKYPQLHFEVADARKLGYAGQFHAVFSNAALHWMKPPEAVLHGIWNALRPGGRLIAEFGGKGNVAAVIQAIFMVVRELELDDQLCSLPWFFPSIGEYTSLMEQAGFQVKYAAHFARPTRLEGEDGLRSWICMFGGSLLAPFPAHLQGAIISKVESLLKADCFSDGGWTADYQRIRVVGLKPCE
ncbi:SAM-dependent methyltransferase [Sporomusaceae bacterium FL31]|nr:SAM-dependent methyltransferase [Sporomusaceae bacterium FL31]GCE33659.1 SAM-dependent methyltransferase [Sporomusaceae bacterium]